MNPKGSGSEFAILSCSNLQGLVRARIYIGGNTTILNHTEFGGAHIIHMVLGGGWAEPTWCWPGGPVLLFIFV